MLVCAPNLGHASKGSPRSLSCAQRTSRARCCARARREPDARRASVREAATHGGGTLWSRRPTPPECVHCVQRLVRAQLRDPSGASRAITTAVAAAKAMKIAGCDARECNSSPLGGGSRVRSTNVARRVARRGLTRRRSAYTEAMPDASVICHTSSMPSDAREGACATRRGRDEARFVGHACKLLMAGQSVRRRPARWDFERKNS